MSCNFYKLVKYYKKNNKNIKLNENIKKLQMYIN